MRYLIPHNNYVINESDKFFSNEWYYIENEIMPNHLLKTLEENTKIFGIWLVEGYNSKNNINITHYVDYNDDYYDLSFGGNTLMYVKYNDYYIHIIYNSYILDKLEIIYYYRYEKNYLDQISKDFFKYVLSSKKAVNRVSLSTNLLIMAQNSKKYSDYNLNAIEKYTTQAIEYINSFDLEMIKTSILVYSEFRTPFYNNIDFLLYNMNYDIFSIPLLKQFNEYTINQLNYIVDNFTKDTINIQMFKILDFILAVFYSNIKLLNYNNPQAKSVIKNFYEKLTIISCDKYIVNNTKEFKKISAYSETIHHLIDVTKITIYRKLRDEIDF